MWTPSRREWCSLVLAALLLLPAVPAVAAEGEGRIAIHLEKALALQGGELWLAEAGDDGLASRRDDPGAAAPEPSLKGKSLEEVALEVRKADEDPARQPSAKGGFGRWVKKHWYVPVLVAVGVGVAVAGSGDNDASGEED